MKLKLGFKSKLRHSLKLLYRLFNSHFVERFLLPFVFSQKRIQTAARLSLQGIGRTSGARIWFHAASAGELESLWPLILLVGDPGGLLLRHEIVVTIMSESAWGALERLKMRLEEIQAKVVFLGYSPWEGGWGARLDLIQPTFFITVKYEAWPDLWVSLQERKIPLVIVGARARNSLRIAKRFTEALTGELPRLFLYPSDSTDVDALNRLFPKAVLQVVNEPRWERVFERSRIGNPRAQELARVCQFLPRPWGVLGNAWVEDLEFLSPLLKRFQGTLWVVPHNLKSENIDKIRRVLIAHRLDFILTQGLSAESIMTEMKNVILVDEMGFLSELYSTADWAYVGGGFGSGIHSTIEPAIYGIPIAIGPQGAEKFAEVGQLQRSGQLTLLGNSVDLIAWVRGIESDPQQNKPRWKLEAESRCGGASQILYSLFEENG